MLLSMDNELYWHFAVQRSGAAVWEHFVRMDRWMALTHLQLTNHKKRTNSIQINVVFCLLAVWWKYWRYVHKISPFVIRILLFWLCRARIHWLCMCILNSTANTHRSSWHHLDFQILYQTEIVCLTVIIIQINIGYSVLSTISSLQCHFSQRFRF